MKNGTNNATPNDFVDNDQKLWLNMPEGTLTRFSKFIEFLSYSLQKIYWN